MQKIPEDARGIGIQISRLEILKNKSRNTTLTNFIRNKQNNTIHRSTETNISNDVQPLINSNAIASVSGTTNNEDKLCISIPMEIQNEILDVDKNKKQTESKKDQTTVNIQTTCKNESKTVQTHHENFFKQIKSGISRPTKIEMPPIQEIDMSVLIELPADIRNEILNEYSAKKNEGKMDININKNNNSSSSKPISIETKYDEQNISYSQVDPEFLAALSEDLRRDVQSYCTAKKAEKCLKLKKNETNINRVTNENIKHNKKVENNSKNKNGGKSGKTVSKNKKKNVQTIFKTIKNVNEIKNVSDNKINVGITKFTTACIDKIESVNDQITADEAEIILSHNRTISEDNDNTNQHQDILIEVVKRLLNLPLKQVVLISKYC